MSLPELTPAMNFAEASSAVVDFLNRTIPMGLWSITRFDGERQVHLEVRDDEYGVVAGDTVDWSDTFCSHMVDGNAPRFATDAMSVPEYAAAPAASELAIGSYAGVPITRVGGEVYGTICGIDPERKDASWAQHQPMLELVSRLLSTILEADLAHTGQRRTLERAELDARTDELTGLLDRRGWNLAIEFEDGRYRRFGDPAAIVVVDLDGLEAVNDVKGHPGGDELIVRAATTLRSLVRAGDLVARLGGDEFGVIVADATPSGARALESRLIRGLQDAGISASVGQAPFTLAGGFAEAWAAADRVMVARKRGRLQLAS